MATYLEQLDTVRNYRVRDGGSYRGNCPFCGGRNTFGIANMGGVLKWGCFRASCDVGGIQDKDRTAAGLASWQNQEQPSKALLAPVPSLLTAIDTHPDILAFLKRWNSLEAYQQRLVAIRYSPVEDRVMFPVGKEGYTGRAREGVKPKWKKYGDCAPLFTCGLGKTGILVEDALSACAVGIIPEYTGLSLLGTVLSPIHKSQLRAYNKVVICLDPDARAKSLELLSQLRGTAEATVRFIPDDLKAFGPEEIKDILK